MLTVCFPNVGRTTIALLIGSRVFLSGPIHVPRGVPVEIERLGT